MKYIVIIGFVMCSCFILNAQSGFTSFEGSVSYLSSQNVYVRFESTKGISVGDTLYFNQNDELIPVLQVSNLSSISCVCTPFSSIKLKVDDKLISKQRIPEEVKQRGKEVIEQTPIIIPADVGLDSLTSAEVTYKQEIDGRISLSSYSNLSNTPGGDIQRMRYTFSLNAQHIGDSKFSAETYISFVHRNNSWDEIKENVFNGLKIYNLAVRYELTESIKIWLGRKINPNISNIGAIDGLHVDKKFESFSIGGFVGTRPDYLDYSFNAKLFQFGAYIGHRYSGKKGFMQSTLAFVEQKNSGNTDRRFAYLQHSNSLLKNLHFIGSAELELYQKVDGVQHSDVNLTNLNIMLRYRVIKTLSFTLSYNSRQNLIYYESYKDYVEELLEKETLNGIRFQVNFRPIKRMALGMKAGYRSRKQDPRPSKNLYAYLSYSLVPRIKVSTLLSATFLETSYLSGKIYSIGISKDIIARKLYGSITYRNVDYQYLYYESSTVQNVGEINITWRIIKRLSLSIAYEGTFEKTNTYNRVFVNLSKRF